MNILFLNAKRTWAGVVTWNLSLSKKLQQKGHTCHIITGKNSALAKNKPTDINITTRKFGMNYSPLTILYIYNFIRKNNIDIIVTNVKKEVIAGGIAGKLAGIPVIRLIGNEKDFYSGKFMEMKFVDHDIFPCEYTRKLALDRFGWLRKEKTEVIHTGKDIPTFSEDEIVKKREFWGIKKNEIVIGVSDRLDENKGIDLLIQAFSQLTSKYDNIKLVISGKGSYVSKLKELVNDLKITDKVYFAGFVTDVMLTARAYDIAVLASYFESFPNTVVEYMASNTAVIATDVGGVSELVLNDENGYLIKKENLGELGSALEKLIIDDGLRRKFSEKALLTIKKGFTEDIMSEKTLKLFKEIKKQ